MAELALSTFNYPELVVGALSTSQAWLTEVAKYENGLPPMGIGTSQVNYMTAPDVTWVTKGGTSVIANSANATVGSQTTAQAYMPVELYDYELERQTPLMVQNLIKKQSDAVLAAVEGILADAFVSATITTNTQTLVSPNDNFADLSDAMPKLNALIGQVRSKNGGRNPGWIVLGEDAYGRVLGASPYLYGGLNLMSEIPTYLNIPLFPIIPTTSSGMNGDADPCGWVGAKDAVNFAWSAADVGEGFVKDVSTGLYRLPLSFTVTYGLNEVSKLMGEMINATS
jgi:hypothetical protein